MIADNPSSSSSYNQVSKNSFSIQYVDQSQATGDYIKDDFQIGGANVSQLQMGLATKTTIPTGIIGIGFTADESTKSEYPNLLDLLVSQGLIASKAYSLYLVSWQHTLVVELGQCRLCDIWAC
jgi:hypothetical protein